MEYTKFWFIIPLLMVGLIVGVKKIKGLPFDIANDIIVLIFTCFTLALVISTLRFLNKID